jgi:hypothetical protein
VGSAGRRGRHRLVGQPRSAGLQWLASGLAAAPSCDGGLGVAGLWSGSGVGEAAGLGMRHSILEHPAVAGVGQDGSSHR